MEYRPKMTDSAATSPKTNLVVMKHAEFSRYVCNRGLLELVGTPGHRPEISNCAATSLREIS